MYCSGGVESARLPLAQSRKGRLDRLPKEIPGLPSRWGQFALCLLYHMAAPLAPLLLEWGMQGGVSLKSSTLTICLYALGLANSSRDPSLFGMGLAIAIVEAVMFGIVLGNPKPPAWTTSLTYVCSGIIALTHAIERYNRHIVGQEPFWVFLDKGK